MSEQTPTTFAELIERKALEIGDGYRAKLEELGGNGPIFLRAGLLGNQGTKWDEGERFQTELAPSFQSKLGLPGDTMMTTKGNSVGRAGYVPCGSPSFVYSPHLSYWRSLDPARLSSEFLRYWAHSPEFKAQLHAMAGSTDMAPYLSLSDQRRLRISLPETGIQKAIGAVLGALDDKIAVNDRIVGTHEQLLQARFEQLRIDEDPDSSSVIQVSEIVEFSPTVQAPRSGDAVYLDMAAVPTERATVLEWSRREPKSGTRFANGDTVMARITPCLENGKTAFIDFMGDGEIGIGSTEFIVMRARSGIPVQLPYFLARSPRFRTYAIQNMVGSSGRQRVNAIQLVDFPIRRPDSVSISAFGAVASKLFAHMRSLTDESRNLAELRDTLLPRLMSGEIRVRDAEKVVEDVT